MNTELEKVVNLNSELSAKVHLSLPVIIQSLQKTKFQYTGKALTSFIAKSNSLNNSILNSCVNGDLYSAWVVFRPMIEHNFKHLYIYTKALNEDNDSVGFEYYNGLKASEDLESISKIINYTNWSNPSGSKWNTKGENNNVIKEKANQFNLTRIFDYLILNNNSIKEELMTRFKKDYFLKWLTEYTNLSSSVHGGAFADLALLEVYKSENGLKKNLYKYALNSFSLHKSLIETTYLFAYTMDESNRQHHEEIKNIVV